jgi:hypothetical protein
MRLVNNKIRPMLDTVNAINAQLRPPAVDASPFAKLAD